MPHVGRKPLKPKARVSTPERRLADTLRALREAKGWSAQQLVDKLDGIGFEASRPAIYSWENATRLPSLKAVFALAEVYGKKPSQILG